MDLAVWYYGTMPKRSSKRSGPKDLNETAFSIVQQAVGTDSDEAPQKNAAAVELGRLGGKIGGRARAARLTAEERSAIARAAARARWSKADAG